jgi:hypothetical protein
MNSYAMGLANKEIAKENKRFCAKLIKTQSHYHVNDMLENAEHLEYVASNISHNARRCISASTSKLRPSSRNSTTTSSFKRKYSNEYLQPIYKI